MSHIGSFKLDLQCYNKIHNSLPVCPFCFHVHNHLHTIKDVTKETYDSGYFECVNCKKEFWMVCNIKVTYEYQTKKPQ